MGGKDFFQFVAAASAGSPPVVTSGFTDPSVFGGSALSYTLVGDTRATVWTARKHWPRNSRVFSLLIRIVPNFTGTPPYVQRPVRVGSYGGAMEAVGGLELEFQDNGTLYVRVRASMDALSDIAALYTSHVFSFTSGVARDVMITCDGSRLYISEEGVEVYNEAVTGSTANHVLNDIMAGKIFLGAYPCNLYVNELCIWDTCEPHVYSARTDFISASDIDGVTSVGAGAGNIRAGTTELINGITVTGTLDLPLESDVRENVEYDGATKEGTLVIPAPPSAGDLRKDVVHRGVTGTCVPAAKATTKIGVTADDGVGEYAATERYTDVPESKVERDYAYAYNSTTSNRTGERDTVSNTLRAGEMRGGNKGGVMRGGDR